MPSSRQPDPDSILGHFLKLLGAIAFAAGAGLLFFGVKDSLEPVKCGGERMRPGQICQRTGGYQFNYEDTADRSDSSLSLGLYLGIPLSAGGLTAYIVGWRRTGKAWIG